MFPQEMKYLLSQNNVARNTFKIEPRGSTVAKAGSIVTCVLPTNTLVDLDTFSFWFDVGVINSTDPTLYARLPNKIASLIERVDVSIGGKSVSSFNGYNVLTHIKEALLSRTEVQSNSVNNHERIVTHTNDYGENLTNVTAESYGGNNSPTWCINKWYGFLGECAPRVLDTSLLPEVQIRLTLAPSSVCIVADDYLLNNAVVNHVPLYEISNMHFTVDTLSFNDGSYEKLVAAKMQQDGYIQIPYKSYMSTTGSTNNTRFSVSSQSVDALYAVMRDNTYNTAGLPVTVRSGAETVTSPIGKISKYFKFSRQGIVDWQWKVNGVLYPQYKASPVTAYNHLQGLSKTGETMISNMQMFFDSHCIIPYKLNLSDEVHMITGYDTRQTASAMEFNVTGLQANSEVAIFAEHTSVLKIGLGQQVIIEE
jgi:hypothetical protein